MSKCKAGQSALAVQALNLERIDEHGRVVRVQLPSAKTDLEVRRNQLSLQLLNLKDATDYIESVARSAGRSEELTVVPSRELRNRAKSVADKLLSYTPVRGYALGVTFDTVAKDYVENQIYFHAVEEAFARVQRSLAE